MELAIASYFNTKLPLRDRLSLIRDAGISIISIWGEHPVGQGYLNEDARKLVAELAAEFGLTIHSIHAPFVRSTELFSEDESLRARLIADYKGNIRVCEQLGVGVLILHTQRSAHDVRGRKQLGLSGLSELIPEAERAGVRIAIENMYSTQSLEVLGYLFSELPPEIFGLCFDTSHDNLMGDPFRFLERWGDRLLVTHISDNRGRRDDHLLPWEGMIDWEAFARAFPKDFPGPLLMEAEMVATAVKDPPVFLEEVRRRGERLVGMIKQ